MTTAKVGFALRGRNPDVLTCIANLSNDEVFTPPEFANRMLDTVADAWAADHDGATIWADPTVRFLDPFTKSGVFLREITSRLTDGLSDEIPDLRQRVEHILTKQVFGIGITHLTSLLARRSVYCSKYANGPHSIASTFTVEAGNIWFERLAHTWADGRCVYCGASRATLDRGEGFESHAYAFIHTDDIRARLAELFGADMQFDVIIGNPPYQLGQSGGEAVGSFAMPVYHRFVQVAKDLEPRCLTMVIPSRWFAGGRGLSEFREEMLSDRRLRSLVDYPDARDVFGGVDIAGGISYFLWDSSWNGPCEVTTVRGDVAGSSMLRYLDEYDILVRYNEAIRILKRVLETPDVTPFQAVAARVSPIQPFSLRTNFRGANTADGLVDPVLVYQNGGTGFMERNAIPRNVEWVDQWKVFLSGTASEHGGQANKDGTRRVFSRVLVAGPGTACTETYLVAGRFDTEVEAFNFSAYLRTRFVRFLVSLRTNTQHLYSERLAFVPDLPMDRRWADGDLYAKYGLTDQEIDFIESMIRPMELDGGPSDD